MVASMENVITESEIESIDNLTIKTCDKIRDANQQNQDINGRVLNISPSGAMIRCSDGEFVKKLAKQNWTIFALIFKLQQPMRISGEVIYIYESGDSFIIGIHFKGSGFGSKTSKLIEKYIKEHKRKMLTINK
ncbi:PilZ domain-containing protein [Spirochaetota bacterium]